MGIFAEPSDVRSMTNIPELINLTDTQLDELYVIPAERMIEARYNLTINTDNEPECWAGYFDSVPSEKTKFLNDYRRSVCILVNHLGRNPGGYKSQSFGGVSVSFGSNFPFLIDSLMDKWKQQPTIYRS